MASKIERESPRRKFCHMMGLGLGLVGFGGGVWDVITFDRSVEAELQRILPQQVSGEAHRGATRSINLFRAQMDALMNRGELGEAGSLLGEPELIRAVGVVKQERAIEEARSVVRSRLDVDWADTGITKSRRGYGTIVIGYGIAALNLAMLLIPRANKRSPSP